MPCLAAIMAVGNPIYPKPIKQAFIINLLYKLLIF
jgi:hypothetical protein